MHNAIIQLSYIPEYLKNVFTRFSRAALMYSATVTHIQPAKWAVFHSLCILWLCARRFCLSLGLFPSVPAALLIAARAHTREHFIYSFFFHFGFGKLGIASDGCCVRRNTERLDVN